MLYFHLAIKKTFKIKVSNEVRANRKMLDPENENLKKDLEKLRKYLDYKNVGYCKRVLDNIIKIYFKI